MITAMLAMGAFQQRIAEQFGMLEALHPGRIDLGLGRAPGTDQVTAHAIRSDRTQSVYAFPEEVEMIQRYFSKENRDSKVRATVAEGVEVPIYILGSSTDSAHLAAHKGLPYAFASHFAPAQMQAALGIYHNQFRPSKYLDQPNTLAGLNVILAETDEAAERLSTSMIRMMLGVLTGNIDYMQEPVEMSAELREIARHPALQQMLKYTFVGSPETVREQVRAFRDQTRVDEIIAVSHIYHHEDRVKSFELFAEVMRSL